MWELECSLWVDGRVSISNSSKLELLRLSLKISRNGAGVQRMSTEQHLKTRANLLQC